MRRRAAYTRDTLQAHRLPATEHIELDYRPALAAPGQTFVTSLTRLGKVGASLILLLLVLKFVGPFVNFALNGETVSYVAILVAAQAALKVGTQLFRP